ncbi:hypothetical protein QWA68_015213 [Fusarium oxysporum]|nr:hypothetical protein QWA68_015213 [Fusarium oxysporum]
MEGKAIVESHEIQSILERQRRQNGFLSLGDRLRLRSAQSRSNDLSAAVSVHPLVDPNAKGPQLISPNQEEEDQPDDDGPLSLAYPTYNERERYSSNVKAAKARLEEVCARVLDDFKSEITNTSG